MDRLLEAGRKQTWRYQLLKFLIFASIAVAIYLEVYDTQFNLSERQYRTQWRCYSKAAFTHPNPYFGDVNVTSEFASLIDLGFLLTCTCAASAIFGSLVNSCLEQPHQITIVIDSMLVFSCIGWLLYATVGRFSHTGRVCSGQYHNVNEVMYPYDF